MVRKLDADIVRSGTVSKYTPVMSATLVGRAFKMEPAGEQTRAVFLNAEGPVEWTWFVIVNMIRAAAAR